MSRATKVWLFVMVAIALWWFFQGDDPLQLVRQFVGRGRQLSKTTMSNGRDVDQSIDEVVEQVRQAMGRDVDRRAVILARVSANEHPGASQREKQAMQWVCKNDADTHGWSLDYTTTVARGKWGTQAGRRYSTHGEDIGTRIGTSRFEIHEDDLFVAESILEGQLPDITGGSTKFVHMTGYRTFADFLQGNPKVKEWAKEGLIPLYLGDVSTLVVLNNTGSVT